MFVKLSFTELEPYGALHTVSFLNSDYKVLFINTTHLPVESLFEKVLILKGHRCYCLHEKSFGFMPTPEAPRWVANSSYASPSRQYLLKFRHKWMVREKLMGESYEELWIGELSVELGGGESYGSDEEVDKEECHNHGPEVVSSVEKPREGYSQGENARPGA